ncbi:homoserine dehydrogenase [Neobacillus sp. FSL H8-0543]|uniref:homoserine dehydrogenase n=1 Tax=Neobacillus sp. FSL H8-0543 TaxID=2954672 RepID=UPI0031580B55
MSVIKVAILGFGTVGEGVYRTIHSHQEELTAVLGKEVEVAAILIKNKNKEREISNAILVTDSFDEILQLPQLDVVVEAIVGKEPAVSYLKKAINSGCHIITANKEMFAHHGKELLKLAEDNNVSVGFEATVAGGIPVIQTLRQLLKINRVHQIQGILNGTSNFILTEMREKKQSFTEALLLAQENGFAEADPTNDVEGFDAFYKTMILSRIAFGEEPNWKDVELEGITTITSELIETAEKLGLRFKHIASISKEGSQINAIIKPTLVDKSHPFYHVEGVQNAVNIQSDIVGGITLQGPGAGMFPTASAVIEDLVFVCQNDTNNKISRPVANSFGEKKTELKEYWLVHGLTKKYLNTTVSFIQDVSDETYIINGTKNNVEQIFSLHKPLCYFPIIGEFKTLINA